MTFLPHEHGDKQFKPNTTVAAVIVYQNKYLLVEEIENGKNVFNQPAGHIEANENIIDATQREVYEETGLKLSPQYCSGIYYYHRPELNLFFLRFCFVIELAEKLIGLPQDNDILTTHWLTLEQIKAKSAQLRSTMVLECIEDYNKGQKVELSIFKTNL
ncbi:NUDIX hydrolase [Colwelliaceae bacterium 6441]